MVNRYFISFLLVWILKKKFFASSFALQKTRMLFQRKAPEILCGGKSQTEVLEQKFYCHRIKYNKIQQIIERTDR